MRKSLLPILICFCTSTVVAQEKPNEINKNQYINKTFVFNFSTPITPCDISGNEDANQKATTAPKGAIFTVEWPLDNGDLVIAFDGIFRDEVDAVKYNFKALTKTTGNKAMRLSKVEREADNNKRFFLLKKKDQAGTFSDYVKSAKLDISLGSFTTPIKFRPTKSFFTSNLNLGTAIYVKYNLNEKYALGAVVGISLTQVTLDSLSTKYTVKTSTEKPAWTPSASLVFAYKNINITVGGGMDYINKTSVVEKSWIFNGKPWFGFGIGINLFTVSTATSGTPKTSKQGSD